jgi:hypothetical protein
MAQKPEYLEFVLENVEARFPKVNQPYYFDRSEGENGRTVPCSIDKPSAKWQLGVRMDRETAAEFMKGYTQAWGGSEFADAPMPDPTKCNGREKTPKLVDEGDGFWTIKSIHKNCKTSKEGRIQSPPLQVGRDGKLVAEDFELTTGSIVNIKGVYAPLEISGDHSVSFWLNGIQVVQLAERQPIGAFTALDDPEETEAEVSFAPLDKQDTPQVKTRKKKQDKSKEESADSKTDLNDILSKFAPPSEVDDNE